MSGPFTQGQLEQGNSSLFTVTTTKTSDDNELAMNPNESTNNISFILSTSRKSKDSAQIRESILKDRALKRMERKAQNHKSAEELCRAADILLDRGNYVEASRTYIEATNLWPSNPGYYLKLTRAYLKCGLFADAAHAATRALSFEPSSIDARYERGVARLEQGLSLAAKIDFETVILHQPSHSLAHTKLEHSLSLLQSAKVGNQTRSPPPIEGTADGEPVDFAFPRYDDEVLELAELSDSSDCHHAGNGVPCRFYNRDGCVRGPQCEYSHAPDEKSVRDDLGKNVCLYYLLSSCKFGDLKCVYSHSKEALPASFGWWNNAEQIKHVKGILDLAEKKTKEQRALEWSLYKLESRRRSKGEGRNSTYKVRGEQDRIGHGKSKDAGMAKDATGRENIKKITIRELDQDIFVEQQEGDPVAGYVLLAEQDKGKNIHEASAVKQSPSVTNQRD